MELGKHCRSPFSLLFFIIFAVYQLFINCGVVWCTAVFCICIRFSTLKLKIAEIIYVGVLWTRCGRIADPLLEDCGPTAGGLQKYCGRDAGGLQTRCGRDIGVHSWATILSRIAIRKSFICEINLESVPDTATSWDVLCNSSHM